MTKKVFMTFLILVNLLTVTKAWASTPLIWGAIKAGSTNVTNYDVKLYLEATQISDESLIKMFAEADKDYSKFSKLKSEWLERNFEEGLKQLAYVTMIQNYATRVRFDGKERLAFKTTEREYYDAVQKMEDQAVDALLDEGKGIVWARQQFGKKLKEVGYPHKEASSDEDVYWEWYELQKRRIKENMRLQEVQKFEYLKALGYKSEFYVRPTDMFSFAEEVSGIIDEKINGKMMTQSSVSEIISKDNRVQVLLKGVEFLGPETTKIEDLKKEAPEVYQTFMSHIQSEVIPFIDGQLQSKVLYYEQIAEKMAVKYKTVEALEELAAKMKEEFMLSGDYNRLMMAKIYEVAIQGIESQYYSVKDEEKAQARELLKKYIADVATFSKKKLNSSDSAESSSASGTRLEDIFSSDLNTAFHEGSVSGQAKSIKENDYLNQVRKLTHWVTSFQIKKASLNTTPMAVASQYDYKEYEGQQRIEKFLKNKYYEEDLESFREGEFKQYWYNMLEINPKGTYNYMNDQAVDYALGKEVKTEEIDSSEFAELWSAQFN